MGNAVDDQASYPVPLDPLTSRTLIDDLRRTTKEDSRAPPPGWSITADDAVSLKWPGIESSICWADGELVRWVSFVSAHAFKLLLTTG